MLLQSSLSCPVCGSFALGIVARACRENLDLSRRSYYFYACNVCDVISQLPLPSSGFLSAYYDSIDACQSACWSSDDGQRFKLKIARRARQSLAVSLLHRMLRAGEEPYPYWSNLNRGLVVDLGAGSGDFCLAAMQRGIAAEGLEQSVHSIELAASKGIQLHKADLRSEVSKRLAREADNVVLNHVFEHVDNPAEYLKNLSLQMKSGARLVILIPNPNSLWRFLCGSRWYGWDPPVHLHHYPAPALKALLENSGFTVRILKSVGRIDSFAKALESLNLPVKRFRWLLSLLMIPVMPFIAWLGFGPELLCVAERLAGPNVSVPDVG